jgi:hypothetical protein
LRLKELKESKEFEDMLNSWDTHDMGIAAIKWAIAQTEQQRQQEIKEAQRKLSGEDDAEDLKDSLEELNSMEWFADKVEEILGGLTSYLSERSTSTLKRFISDKYPQLK